MESLHPAAVIGTNSWGSAAYETLLRGSSVDEATLRAAMRTAADCGLTVYDLAQDYGFGKAQKMIGSFGTQGIILSAKYTPLSGYRPGCVRKLLEKDLRDFHRNYVDISPSWKPQPTVPGRASLVPICSVLSCGKNKVPQNITFPHRAVLQSCPAFFAARCPHCTLPRILSAAALISTPK